MKLSDWILKGATRQYVIDKIKAPMMKAIIILAKRYPEPTRENTENPNVQILLDIRDKFFGFEDIPCRDEMFRVLWKLLIIEYEHDTFYRYRFDWLLGEIAKSDWQPRNTMLPQRGWTEALTPLTDEFRAMVNKVLGVPEGLPLEILNKKRRVICNLKTRKS